MALKITQATRLGASPCQHYRITIDDAGTSRQQAVDVSALRDSLGVAIEHGSEAGVSWALALLWARRRLKDGATLNQIVGVNIVP